MSTVESGVRLTSLSHGGGCGCKLAPAVLEKIIAGTVGGLTPPDLLVGVETSDDAAVYRINDTQAIVATTDFFMPTTRSTTGPSPPPTPSRTSTRWAARPCSPWR